MVRTMHLGTIRNSERIIQGLLLKNLTIPRQAEDGTELSPYKHEDLVVYLAHRDDPTTDPIIARHCEAEELEVAVFINEREYFAKKMMDWKFIACKECGRSNLADESITMCTCGAATVPGKVKNPYKKIAKQLMDPPPPMTVWYTVFAAGQCTLLYLGFDPNNLDVMKVESDPNVKAPEPLMGLEVVPRTEDQTAATISEEPKQIELELIPAKTRDA